MYQYKVDLIQLVPKNYHRIAHEGTIKERLVAALMVASALGLGGLIEEMFMQMDAYTAGKYGG